MLWLGKKKVAFLPVYRPQIDPLPPDWTNQILRRIYFDPDANGADVSLRTYIHTVSNGRADIEGTVLPMVTTTKIDVGVNTFDDQIATLRSRGFDAGALVMLGGTGAGTAEAGGFWARFVMLEKVGVWAMELTHVITALWDLYLNLPGDLGSFDNMACSCGTHPTVFTKVVLGWLDNAAVVQHSGRTRAYDLHTASLVLPAPEGRTTAVQIGNNQNYFMIEARQKVDQFDAGIGSEGVIVYEIDSPDIDPGPIVHPIVHLKTPTALQPGMAFSSDTLLVQNVSSFVAGFSIRVTDLTQPVEFIPGQLLFYRDFTRNGTGDVDTPSVIGLGGWQYFPFLFNGGGGILYAVNQAGELLFYRDFTRNGTGDVDTPRVIGQFGWAEYKFLFSDGAGAIYGVTQPGQLHFYRDTARDGSNDIGVAAVIGQGGWQIFSKVFAGGDGILYAVVADPQVPS